MASTIIPDQFLVVSAATNKGLLTLSSNSLLAPGTVGWLCKDDGSLRAFVKIVTIVGTTQVTARQFANNDPNSPPSYGLSDLSAFNGAATHLCVDSQPVSVLPPFSVPVY